jgi:hypothetical protein
VAAAASTAKLAVLRQLGAKSARASAARRAGKAIVRRALASL